MRGPVFDEENGLVLSRGIRILVTGKVVHVKTAGNVVIHLYSAGFCRCSFKINSVGDSSES